ncbi:MAG: DUF2933 domain-containing protein [Actinomycetota bacterium]|nr:DUF2933 domain-containing protein [Actinomycetota bacterium]
MLIGLAAAAVVGAVLFPSAAWPLVIVLAVLACPLSMLVMMRSMRGGNYCSAQQLPPGEGTATDAEIQRIRAEIERLKSRPESGPGGPRV